MTDDGLEQLVPSGEWVAQSEDDAISAPSMPPSMFPPPPTVPPSLVPQEPEQQTDSSAEEDVVPDLAAIQRKIEENTRVYASPVRYGRAEPVGLGNDYPEKRTTGDLQKAAQKPINWQVSNLWTENAKLLLASEPKAGKTFFVCEMAIALASGGLLFESLQVPNAVPVGIIAAEDDEGETGRRLDRMCRARGIPMSNLPIFWWPADKIRLNRVRDTEWIRKQVRDLGIRVMIYDPLARMMDGDENNKECVSGVLTPASSMTRPDNEGCSVMIVHHLGKDNPDNPRSPAQRIRGSSDIRSWYTTGMFLTGKLSNGRVGVEIEQRVSGKIPSDFSVKAIEDESESVYGLGAIRLVAKISQSRDDAADQEGSNEQLVISAAEKIMALCMKKKANGVSLSEISLHLSLGGNVMKAALKKLIREENLLRFETDPAIPDSKVLIMVPKKQRRLEQLVGPDKTDGLPAQPESPDAVPDPQEGLPF